MREEAVNISLNPISFPPCSILMDLWLDIEVYFFYSKKVLNEKIRS